MTQEAQPISSALAVIVKKQSGRATIPIEYFCQGCDYLVDTDNEEVRKWLGENRPDLYLPPIGQDSGISCKCPDPVDLEERRRLRKIINMNLPKREKIGPRTFDNFDVSPPGTAEMLEIVKAWAEGRLNETYLTMIGITGCGKSHLLEAAVAYLDTLGLTVRYERVEVMLNQLRHTFSGNEEGGDDIQEVLDWYDQFDVLIFDDLGANSVTKWGVGYLYLILDKRYADGRKVAVGTNIIDFEEMEKEWGARIASRCFDRNSGIVKVLWSEAANFRQAKI